MKNYLNRIDQRILKVVRDIGRAADRQGLRAYIVGGIVRDIILGRENLDIDIVTEGPAIPFAQSVAKTTGAKITVYPQFGTATLQWSFGLRLDLVAARKEFYPHPGALPQVRPGTLKDDLFRRDFTINAMAVCVNRGDFGRLVDEFGGLPDLRGRTIRVLHDRSFVDDPTRILRAARFEQRLHFRIEAATLRLLKKALRTKAVDNVKPPRYFAEFRKMLSEDNPVSQLGRLENLGALRLMDPAWALDIRLLDQVRKRWQRLPPAGRMVREYRRSRWLIFFMANAEAIGGRRLPRMLGKFPLKKEEKESILQVPGTRPLLRRLAVPGLSRSEVYRILKPLTVEMAVYLRLRADRPRTVDRVDRYLTRDAGMRPDIDGEDLKKMGVKPGKEIGAILSGILYQKIDGELKGRRSQLAAAEAMLRRQEG